MQYLRLRLTKGRGILRDPHGWFVSSLGSNPRIQAGFGSRHCSNSHPDQMHFIFRWMQYFSITDIIITQFSSHLRLTIRATITLPSPHLPQPSPSLGRVGIHIPGAPMRPPPHPPPPPARPPLPHRPDQNRCRRPHNQKKGAVHYIVKLELNRSLSHGGGCIVWGRMEQFMCDCGFLGEGERNPFSHVVAWQCHGHVRNHLCGGAAHWFQSKAKKNIKNHLECPHPLSSFCILVLGGGHETRGVPQTGIPPVCSTAPISCQSACARIQK